MDFEEMMGRKSAVAPVRVRAEVGQRVYVGDVRLPDVDFHSRVSDLVNDPARRFLPLSNVEALDARTGQSLGGAPFLLLRLDAIEVIVPLAEPSERPLLS